MFKKCNMCGHEWATRGQFLADPDIELIGYQANFKELMAGLLYFNHACKTTLVLQADALADLYNGPIFETRQTGGENCPGYCLHQDELRSCPEECECTYIRNIIQRIQNIKNNQGYKSGNHLKSKTFKQDSAGYQK